MSDIESSTVSSTWNETLAPPASIPASADIVVIGGGIVGVSTAWFLAKQGVDVVVCEKGYIAGEQSGRNSACYRHFIHFAQRLVSYVTGNLATT